MTVTGIRRGYVVAIALAAACFVLAFAAHADTLCRTGEDVLTIMGDVPLTNVIGKPDQAQALSDVMSDRYNVPHFPTGSVLVFLGKYGVGLFAFDPDGCRVASAALSFEAYNAIARSVGIVPVPVPAAPPPAPDPTAI